MNGYIERWIAAQTRPIYRYTDTRPGAQVAAATGFKETAVFYVIKAPAFTAFVGVNDEDTITEVSNSLRCIVTPGADWSAFRRRCMDAGWEYMRATEEFK